MWLLVSVCLLQSPSPQAPPRDPTPSRPATAVIRGRITDKESGQAIPGAMVAVRIGRDLRTIVADADGRYEFTALPGGSHLVMADGGFERATHLTHVFGDPRSVESTLDVLNKRLLLEDGEVRSDVDFALQRALAIDGRVIDTDGEPMMGVEVSASPAARGSWSPSTVSTDDRGIFRLYGLAPGTYRVCAEPRGGRSMFSSPPVTAARLVKTCFPDVTDQDAARPIELAPGLPPAIEIAVRTHAAFKVSGTIVDVAGIPVRDADVSLIRATNDRGGLYGTVDDGGRFTVNGVTPGAYLVSAEKGRGSGPPPKGEAIAGFLPVTVDGGDVEGLVVPIGRGAVVGGHITFLDGPPPPGQKIRMQVQATSGSAMTMVSWLSFSNARVNDKYTFEFVDLFLPSTIVTHDPPDGWAVASIRYRGREVKNAPVRFETDPDPRTIEIQLTNKVGELSGKVVDDSGIPVAMACIVAAPADAPRPLAITALAHAFVEGQSYRFPAIPAGTYAVAALSPSACIELQENPGVVDELGSALQRVTVAVSETHTLDLRLLSLPVKR